MEYDAPAPCPTCGEAIDESRCVETNYLHGTPGQPGGPVDWYPCGGCLSAFAIEWIPSPGIGGDSWQMSAKPTIFVPGSAVARTIERLGETIASGESKRALADLHAAPEAKRLVRIPEVVEAAWPAFGGRAVPARHLTWFIGDSIRELHDPEPKSLPLLLREPDLNGIRKPFRESYLGYTALVTEATKLLVLGRAGPWIKVKPAAPFWDECGKLDHLKVTLERLAADPTSP